MITYIMYCHGTKILTKTKYNILVDWMGQIFGFSKWKERFIIILDGKVAEWIRL